MAELQMYQWETQFNKSNNVITHTFSNSVKVTLDLTNRIIRLIKGTELVNKFEIEKDYSVDQYEAFLLNVAQGTENLNEIKILETV